MPAALDPKIVARVITLYQEGKTLQECANAVGCSLRSCANFVIKAGIPRRTMAEAKRKLFCDDGFFSSIDTEHKAYVLGWMATDGGISKSNNSLNISLGLRDKEHLETLRTIMKIDTPVREYKGSYAYNGKKFPTRFARLQWTSQQMKADLAKLTITPNKTFTVEAWKGPDHLMPHYWRGVIEGDGSIGTEPCIQLTGTRSITDAFADFVETYSDGIKKIEPHQSHSKARAYRIGGRLRVSRILHIIYDNATVWLPRKKTIADIVMYGYPCTK